MSACSRVTSGLTESERGLGVTSQDERLEPGVGDQRRVTTPCLSFPIHGKRRVNMVSWEGLDSSRVLWFPSETSHLGIISRAPLDMGAR